MRTQSGSYSARSALLLATPSIATQLSPEQLPHWLPQADSHLLTQLHINTASMVNGSASLNLRMNLRPVKRNNIGGFLQQAVKLSKAFPLFWSTSRFYFKEGYTLAEFLSALTKTQRANLRHVVLYHTLMSSYQTGYTRSGTRRDWPASNVREGRYHARKDLDCLELHLELWTFGDGRKASSVGFQLESVEATVKALEMLGFLRLKRASVTISYAEAAQAHHEARLTNAELTKLAERYQQRLLDPGMSDQNELQFLSKRIEKVKRSLEGTEKAVEVNQEQAQKFQKMAHEGRAIASRMKGEISRLEATLNRGNPVEIKDVMDMGSKLCGFFAQQQQDA